MAKEIYAANIAEHFTKTVETTFLLREITKKETQENKKQYYDILLQDSSGTLWGTIWEELMSDCHESLKGKVVTVKALVTKDTKGAFRLVVRLMEASEDYQMADYINGLTEKESAKFTEILWKYINSIKNECYRYLVSSIYKDIPELDQFPATLKKHHNFSGGFLVYTASVTCLANYMLHSLSHYNINPSYNIPYQADLLTAGALLHGIGTIKKYTPSPDMHRIPESIPLTRYKLSIQYIQDAVCKYREVEIKTEELNLLLHMVGCVYENTERKPMLREAVILKEAVQLHEQIEFLEYFIHANCDKNGMVYDKILGNYIYIPKEGV
ncbi:MAG: hypothetical protein K2G55_16305 [Lachnospiraceae bacterium]|nr:hypothetical protein [Lachnospiraceae bacterium]MDE7205490.1 hypothetical protein [Lachnospiraceae bacterium]